MSLLGAFQMSDIATDSARRFTGLFLLQQPLPNVINVVKDKPSNFRPRRAQLPSGQALKCAHRTIQLPREVGFADVPVEY